MCVSYNDSLNPLCRNRQPGPPWGAVVQPRAPDRRSAPAVSISLVCVCMSVSVYSYIHIDFKGQAWAIVMRVFFFLHSYVVLAALTVPTERFVDVTVLIVQDHIFDIILSAWCSHKNIKYGPLLCSFSAQPNRLVRVPCFYSCLLVVTGC